MNRFRIALLVVLAVATAAVAVTLTRAAGPPAFSGGVSAPLLPAAERSPAPEFRGIDAWLNSGQLSVARLRGRVVLVDFWTFSCVNCVRTLPHLRTLYDTYRSRGFLIVGVHSPEFDFERVVANVRAAVRRLGVTWPVAVDSSMATWNAYANQYWPCEYLLDQEGRIAYVNVGEGGYAATGAAVASLLGVRTAAGPAPTPVPSDITPELYAGSDRGQLAGGAGYGPPGSAVTYPDHGPPSQPDAIQVTGTWTDFGQYLMAGTAGHVRLRFHADSLYVVAGSPGSPLTVTVWLDGSPVAPGEAGPSLHGSGFSVPRQDLYALLVAVPPGEHLLDLRVPAGFQLFTFTFG